MASEILYRGSPLAQASKALILLHGRGGTAENIISLADLFCDERFYVAAPQAPNRTWYPHGFMDEDALNASYLSSSIETIQGLIDETAKKIPKDQIYLMGFSQGACLSLEISSRSAAKYGGIVAFTGGLMGSTIHEERYHGNFEGTQVFIGTSDQDPYIPLTRVEQSKKLIERMGAAVTLKVYKGTSHTITGDEIDWVKKNMITGM
jgi:phospholipase/carboxylesterase